jgi:hypothetical protein
VVQLSSISITSQSTRSRSCWDDGRETLLWLTSTLNYHPSLKVYPPTCPTQSPSTRWQFSAPLAMWYNKKKCFTPHPTQQHLHCSSGLGSPHFRSTSLFSFLMGHTLTTVSAIMGTAARVDSDYPIRQKGLD